MSHTREPNVIEVLDIKNDGIIHKMIDQSQNTTKKQLRID